MAAGLESLRGEGRTASRPLGTYGDEEDDEDSLEVSWDLTLTCGVVNSCSSQMHIPVFTIYSQVLLSVLVQHGQMGLCFYDSKDSSLNYMVDTPDNHELHLLARGK